MKKYKCSLFFLLLFVLIFSQISKAYGIDNASLKQLPEKKNVDSSKIWTIKFTTALDINSLMDGIVVKDFYGKKISTDTKLSNEGDEIFVSPPSRGYEAGEIYYLNIYNTLRSRYDKLPLEEAVQMKFTIQSDVRPGWNLAWSDEFNGADASPVDSSKWGYNIGGDGWGNNELGYYTDSIKNSFQENGKLVIRALKENYKGSHYTTARLLTRDTFEQTYGRFEARIKIPGGQGLWPAFWMLGDDSNLPEDSWEEAGEIDIMENVGNETTFVYGSLHGPGYYDVDPISSSFSLPDGQEFSKDYHTYAIEWDKSTVRFYVDEYNYATVAKSKLPQNSKWVFNKPFYIILNLAVGGDWPGNPDDTTVFPKDMYVDYVRVYKK